MRSLVILVLLYACETWTLTTEILRKLQATEMRCFRKRLGISYRDHITNDAVRDRIRQAIGPHGDILTTVKKRKLKWFQDQEGLPRQFYRAQCKTGEEEADKRSDGRITSLSGQGWSSARPLRESENKIKWRERVASSVAPQRSSWLCDRCKVVQDVE